MALKKRYFCLLLLSCVALTVFSGCDSIPRKRDLTKRDFNELKNYPPIDKYGERKEPEKPEDIQYYISTKVILKLCSKPSVLTVDYLGNVIKKKWKIREQVTIASNEKGKLLSKDKNGYLIIGFEENYPEYFLRFGQLFDGDDERYYLIFDDNQNYTITYGDGDYNVYFFGDDFPHLMIKKKELPLRYNDIRQAPGWPVFSYR
jgi:hypothetical protein